MRNLFQLFLILSLVLSCSGKKQGNTRVFIYQTSASGDKLKQVVTPELNDSGIRITIDTSVVAQQIIGFGGAFTESSAYLLNKISPENRRKIISAYFSEDEANYSLCRTHMNSCDFSLSNYSYAPLAGDTLLSSFSIAEDMNDIIPMIRDAMATSEEGFKIIASPWTAPPWMKDNKAWNGGKLLPEYYPVWAKFFSKYTRAYQEQGIDIWGFTVENEPLGNDENWESMHFSPEETADFIKNHLGPELKSNFPEKKLLVYDQNRGDELKRWADVLLSDLTLSPFVDGTAVHWYSSTIDWFPESLKYTSTLAPNKLLIHTEGCIDAEIPHWKEDDWYWSKEATDWGFDWASEENKANHPKYTPVYRYARDIIGCLNSGVQGWIDWNMVLNRQGGPNHAKNWCIAPVIVDIETDSVYFTPIYYTMVHFSKFIRPGARVVELEKQDDDLMVTAARNSDGSLAIVLLNTSYSEQQVTFLVGGDTISSRIDGKAIQTILVN